MTYVGKRADQSTVAQAGVVDEFGFERYSLNSFSDLTQVTFGSVPVGRYQFDNVVLTAAPAAVPKLPTTLTFGLLTLGLGGLMIGARRRRAAPSS